MKRQASHDYAEGSRKRLKTYSFDSHFSGAELFDFPEHQRYITSIIPDQNLDERPGYVVGKIFMKFPESEKKMRFVMSTEESELGRKTTRVEIVFGKQCSKQLRRRGVKFQLSHDILLSLRGCFVANSGTSSNGVIGTLNFTEKVLLKIISPGRDTLVVDLWDSNPLQPSKSPDSEWFDPPKERPAEKLALATHTKKLSKRDIRTLKKRVKDLEELAICNVDANKTATNAVAVESTNLSITESAPAPSTPVSFQEVKVPVVPVEEVDGPLNLKAGCRCSNFVYTPLSNATKSSGPCNVVGVAFANSYITQTSTGDYTCTLHLVDSAHRLRSDNSHILNTPTTIVCFARVDSKWLPTVQEGDIVVLHNIKARESPRGSNLVGYKDKLQWAIYGQNGRFNHGTLPSDTPKETITDRGFRFSPFLQTKDQTLLNYCFKLRLWWNAVEREKKKFLGKTHQVGAQVVTPPPERSARPWLLIKDATPSTASNGYFNCIAEVVHKHRPDQACYEVYVTDYTSNDQCPTYDRADWCPPGLAKSILRVELWDRSTSFGSQMEIGDIFSFKNLRMRMSNNGYYEAKMQELKIAKLDPDDGGSPHIALKGLLERKTKWAMKHKIEKRLEKLEYTKIEEVEMRVRFNCIVEILYVDLPDGSGSARVYVTDYTANDLLPEPDLDVDFFHVLQKRVFKIVLRDSQAEAAKSLERGNVCVFQKVIMKLFNKENVGDLGGEQQLIKRLNPGLPSHRALMEGFESRKKAFFGTADVVQVSPRCSESPLPSASTYKPHCPEISERADPRSNSKISTTIKQLQSRVDSECLFVIPARVKWAKPRELRDYCRPYCEKCSQRIPPNQRACVACDDFDHEFVSFKYNFNLSIEDEEGSEMPIAVLDEALFLTDLPRVNLKQDTSALEEFRACFEALAGNVLEYQDDLCGGNEDAELRTPFVRLYGCRYEEEGRDICQLLTYTSVEN